MEIKLENVEYNKIINGVTLSFKEGSITSIIGPNGSGKTILLECINGERIITKGTITGIEDNKIGYISQNLNDTFFCDTLEKELELTLEENDYPKEKISKRIVDSLKMIGLPEYFLSRDPMTLSSSEKRLAALARAITFNPDIIVMDEPTIGMSDSERKNLIQIIKKIKRRFNKTIILATQDMELVNVVSDYVYAISNGNVIAEGDKYSVFKKQELLNNHKINQPFIIIFEDYVLKNKKIKLGYRDEMNDLVKDILRNLK